MKLTYLSIQDYRSIEKAELKNLGRSAILIGPNNEGKSNILHGLNACLKLLRSREAFHTREGIYGGHSTNGYSWLQDYPIQKQMKCPSGTSNFELHFELTDSDKKKFADIACINIKKALSINFKFKSNNIIICKITDGEKIISSDLNYKIFRLISDSLDVAYIPAIRSATASFAVVMDLVLRELRGLQKNKQYLELQKQLKNLEKPILNRIEQTLIDNLQAFLGKNISGISINIRDRYELDEFGKSCEIIIDDGIPTSLERKGEGVQSLAAISLIVGVLKESNNGKDLMLLMEEPECHLHPQAIHRLRDVLALLRQEHQLIITTHCPLLVERQDVSANVIVAGNKTFPAKSLDELRKILGVRTSDNLQHAALVIIVEGPDDVLSLKAILMASSTQLAEAFEKGIVAFYHLGGASKLSYALQGLQTALCNYFVFLDDDDEGRRSFYEAEKALLVTPANIKFSKCEELDEAEFEDLLDPNIYSSYFYNKYSIDIKKMRFSKKLKWSKRVRKALARGGCSSSSGEAWPDESLDKYEIAKLVALSPFSAIHPSKKMVIETLAEALELKLQSLLTQ